jgi:hypothetical protein
MGMVCGVLIAPANDTEAGLTIASTVALDAKVPEGDT